MKIGKISTIPLLFMCLLLSCARLNVSTKPGAAFSPHYTVAVVCDVADPLAIQRALEELLLSRGFGVVTERLAKMKIIMQDRTKNKSLDDSKKTSFLNKAKESPSVYILHFSYKFHYLTVYQYYIFTNFIATITDLTTGEVVTTADFSQSSFGTKPISEVLEQLVNKLKDATI